MNKYFRTIVIVLLALFSCNFVRAEEEENALPDPLAQLQNTLDASLNSFRDGYTTPMRIKGSKGNASVDIGIDTVRYIRSGENGENGKVSFDAHINLQIPFAIEDDKKSTKINFKGKDLSLVGGGSSTLSMEVDLPPITILKNKILDVRIKLT